MLQTRWRIATLLLALSSCLAGDAPAPSGPDQRIPYAQGEKLADLANGRINESSGLACSRLAEGVFWTHNDSGDEPRLYAFDAAGRDLGGFLVGAAEAVDWEDMASFRRDGKSFLLLADTGDNLRKRNTCTLYVVEEPAATATQPAGGTVTPTMKITFRYPDGRHDCEAVAVDAQAGKIYLAAKETPLTARIYELPLPAASPRDVLTAKEVAGLSVVFATAMDISPDGLRAVILNYGAAYEYQRKPDETWPQAFRRTPRKIPTPKLAQAEAICYGPDGVSLYLTSEKLPTPFCRIPSPLTGEGRVRVPG